MRTTPPQAAAGRVINVDGHPAYARAIHDLEKSGELGRRYRCRPSPYLNNVIEQDHRFIKKRVAASLGFRSAEGAWRTIEGNEDGRQLFEELAELWR
jgi:transposase, IS6 family